MFARGVIFSNGRFVPEHVTSLDLCHVIVAEHQLYPIHMAVYPFGFHFGHVSQDMNWLLAIILVVCLYLMLILKSHLT